MATSSIFHNVVIKDRKSAERFIEALDKARIIPEKAPTDEINAVVLEEDSIRTFLADWIG